MPSDASLRSVLVIGSGPIVIGQAVFSLDVPALIALNKVDRLKAGHIASQIVTAANLGDSFALHPVAATTGDGVGALKQELAELLLDRSSFRPCGAPTPAARVQVAELVRQKALALTRDKVPHAIPVEVEELSQKTLRALIHVETDSQKQILIGKGGSMINEIGVRAARDSAVARAQRLPRLAGEGKAALPPRRSDARAARDLTTRGRLSEPPSWKRSTFRAPA